MNGALAWALVALGLGVILVRRRSFAVGLITAQALLLAAIALGDATGGGDVGAAAALAVRGVALAVLFLFVVSRTREPRRSRTGPASPHSCAPGSQSASRSHSPGLCRPSASSRAR